MEVRIMEGEVGHQAVEPQGKSFLMSLSFFLETSVISIDQYLTVVINELKTDLSGTHHFECQCETRAVLLQVYNHVPDLLLTLMLQLTYRFPFDGSNC